MIDIDKMAENPNIRLVMAEIGRIPDGTIFYTCYRTFDRSGMEGPWVARRTIKLDRVYFLDKLEKMGDIAKVNAAMWDLEEGKFYVDVQEYDKSMGKIKSYIYDVVSNDESKLEEGCQR